MLNSNYQISNVSFKIKLLTVFSLLFSNTLQNIELFYPKESKIGTKVGTQSVQSSCGIIRVFKIKNAKCFQFRIIFVHPAGLEPATC